MPRFDQLVFSGGGTRCFWQGGFLKAVRGPLELAPRRLSGVSGGALSLVGYMADASEDVLEEMASCFGKTDHNIAWNTPEDDGVTPHQRLYRECVHGVIRGGVERRVAEGPPAQILLGHPPEGGRARWTGSAAAMAYEAELHLVGAPHFDWAEKAGVTTSFVDVNDAARQGRLADLVCAAATIPPVFEPPVWDGRPVIDGGMADQAPMPEPDEGETLILLTRHYKGLEPRAGRLYLEPEEETPADKIDFTDPGKIRDTWEAGLEDGRRFLKAHGLA
ncbi:patatin-like phospholipase family protein [Pseudoroseicyclus sp. CLL3-39]|uniref:Patatin-like phospholipase family protein n=1 Tax=Pseudoroseicyclus tamaricis TaxID=2705421 RepID=A0A6B2K1V8_9RHOB|nr:patatin-like phospholipase family protein [Pseudoroseicyclus tamaricis]